jgi:hypothetical protein
MHPRTRRLAPSTGKVVPVPRAAAAPEPVVTGGGNAGAGVGHAPLLPPVHATLHSAAAATTVVHHGGVATGTAHPDPPDFAERLPTTALAVAAASAGTTSDATALGAGAVALVTPRPTKRFALPPALPPMPPPPTTALTLVSTESARQRSALQAACVAFATGLAAAQQQRERAVSQAASSGAAASSPPPPNVAVAIFENDQCTWHFRAFEAGGSGGAFRAGDTASPVDPALALPPLSASPLAPSSASALAPAAGKVVVAAAAAAAGALDPGAEGDVSASDAVAEARVARVTDALAAEFALPTGEVRFEIKTFRARVKAAFAAQARAFRRDISRRDEVIASQRAALALHEPGGATHDEWRAQLEETRHTVARQDERIRSLVKLLERTGVAMKKLERRLADSATQQQAQQQAERARLQQAQLAQQQLAGSGTFGGSNTARIFNAAATLASFAASRRRSGAISESMSASMIFAGVPAPTTTGVAPGDGSPGPLAAVASFRRAGAGSHHRRTIGDANGIDWGPLYEHVPELRAEQHDPATIVRDIVELVTVLKDRAADVDMQYETAVDRFNERDRQCVALRKEVAQLTEKLDEADGLMDGLLADIRRLQAEAEAAEVAAAAQRRAFDLDKEALQRRVLELEGSIAKSVEAKPFFVGLGRSLAVLPFLRYEGRVRNLDLPKADVEAVIQRIWAKRDPERSSLRRALVAIAAHLNAAYPGHAAIDMPAGGQLATPDDEIVELVDYDNVKFVRRTGTNFIDFVTQLLLDKSSALVYGGEAFDFDAPYSVTPPSATTTAPAAAGPTVAAAPALLAPTNSNLSAAMAMRAGASGASGAAVQQQRQRRARSKSQVVRKGDQLRGTGRDWKGNPAFCVPTPVAEIAYSLMEGCERFKYDADIELFRAIIREEVSELAWFDQMIMLAKLKAALLQAGRLRSGGRSGTASVQVIMQALYEFFPCKEREAFAFLRNALLLEARKATGLPAPATGATAAAAAAAASSGTAAVAAAAAAADAAEDELLLVQLSVHELFESNQYGNQGAFCEGVRDQHLEETCMYSAELSTAAAMCADPNTGRASIRDLREALVAVDPAKPREEVDSFIARVVAILLDEDGVDPFEVAPQQQQQQQQPAGETGSEAAPTMIGRSRSDVGRTLFVPSADVPGITPRTLALVAPSHPDAMAPSSSLAPAPAMVESSSLNALLLPPPPVASGGMAGGGGGGGGATSGRLHGTNFRAHELMIMLEEGRSLKQVRDSDLVDCERFASACRGVFAKRFGARQRGGEAMLEMSMSASKLTPTPSQIFSVREHASSWRQSLGQAMRANTTTLAAAAAAAAAPAAPPAAVSGGDAVNRRTSLSLRRESKESDDRRGSVVGSIQHTDSLVIGNAESDGDM